MPVEFEPILTDRLILRRFKAADLAEFMAYRNDPGVARFQAWSGIDKTAARRFIAEQQHRQAGVSGAWLQIALEVRQSGQLAGDLALLVREDDPRQAEIGYTLARAHQHRGMATEGVSALLDFIFCRLHLHRVIALVDCRNQPSWALLERLRFRREAHHLESFWSKGEWTDEYCYAKLRDEWLR